MARDFRHYCHTTHPKPGAVWVWAGAGGPRIANLMVQEPAPERGHARPGRARLEHVNQALRALRKLADDEQWPSLALPRLATGVGGLPWGEVEPIIRQHLGTLTIPVAIYVAYKPGVKAKEI
jgi:O-acetyl-ADP-ribose deacetylase (regulator of RNase III)